MNTRITTKLAAMAVTLMLNGLMLGAVAYLFGGHAQTYSSQMPLARSEVAALFHQI